MEEILSAEVVVIGGGVIGSAVAFYLSREGAEVLLVEAEDIASGASGACDGFLSLQTKSLGPHLHLALESLGLYRELAGELGPDIEFRQEGGLLLATSQDQMKVLKERAKELADHGVEVELLGISELKSMLPEVGKEVKGGSFCALEAQVNPLALVLRLVERAKEMGARVMTGCRVENIVVANDRVREVHTNSGVIRSRRVVCAAGVGSNEIGHMIIVDVPVLPQKGQILVTEPRDQSLKPIVYAAEYLGAKTGLEALTPGDEVAMKLGLGFTCEQTVSGNFLLGSTREFAGFDRNTTPEGMKAIAANAVRYLPFLGDLDVIRSFAGLRPCSPDGLPILGTVKGVKGFFLATGHSGDGVSLAPVTGKVLADLVLDGKAELDIAPFSLYRFK